MNTKISRNIKVLRVSNSLTQTDLAEMLKCSQRLVSNWEHNRRQVSVQNLLQLSEIFGVSLDRLVKKEIRVR